MSPCKDVPWRQDIQTHPNNVESAQPQRSDLQAKAESRGDSGDILSVYKDKQPEAPVVAEPTKAPIPAPETKSASPAVEVLCSSCAVPPSSS